MSKSIGLLLFALAVIASGINANPRQDDGATRTMRQPGSGHGRWRFFQNRPRPTARYLCPNKEFIRLGNGCYHFSTMMANWQEAHFSCNDLDPSSHLASLESAWEDGTIRSYLNRPELAPLERWIGGIYDWKRGAWVWGSTGQPFSYQGFSRRTVSNPHWECTFMDPMRRYRWIHDSCLVKRHYICEAPLSRVVISSEGDKSDNGKEPT